MEVIIALLVGAIAIISVILGGILSAIVLIFMALEKLVFKGVKQ